MIEHKPTENNTEPSDALGYRIPGTERRTPAKSEEHSPQKRKSDVIAALAMCAIVGALIDRAFGTFPWGVACVFGFGVVVAMAGAFYDRKRGKSAK